MNKAHHFHQGRNAAPQPDDAAPPFSPASRPAPSSAHHAKPSDAADFATTDSAETDFAETDFAKTDFAFSQRDLARGCSVAPPETRIIEVRPVAAHALRPSASHSIWSINHATGLGLCAFALMGSVHAAGAHADISRAIAKINGIEMSTRALHESSSPAISEAMSIMTGRGQLLTGMELHSPTRIAPSRVAPSSPAVWQQSRRMDSQDAVSWESRAAMTGLEPGLALTHFDRSASDALPENTSVRAQPFSNTAPATTQSPLAQTATQDDAKPSHNTKPNRAVKTQRRLPMRTSAANRRQLMTTLALPPAFPVVARGQARARWTAPPMRRVRVVAKKAAVRAQLMSPQTAAPRAIAKTRRPRTATFRVPVGALPPADMMPRALPIAQSLLPDANQVLPLRDAHGAPMRKIITVAQLKQLPPASQPLPAKLRRSVIRLDDMSTHAAQGSAFAPSLPRLAQAPEDYRRAQTRLAQNSGAAPLRQPIRPVTSSDRLPNQLEVSVGTFVVLLTTSDLDTVAIAEPGVADVSVVNSRAILVNGKTPGVTSLVVVDRFKIRQYQVRVVAAPGGLPRDILAQIALPGVGVRQVRDAIVLEGEVDSAEEVRRAVEIAGIYSPKVINQLTVRGVLSGDAALATQIQSAINLPNVSVRLIGDTTVIDGTVDTLAQRARAETVATALSKKVLNLIALPTISLEQARESLGNGTTADATTNNGATGDGANGAGANGTGANGAGANGAGANGTGDGGANGAAMNNGGAMLNPDGMAAVTPGIRIRQVGDQVILEGFASDQARIDEAVAIAARTGFQVINHVQIVPAITADVSFRAEAERAINIPGIRVSGNARMAILHGTVSDSNQALLAEQIMHAYSAQVENMLQTTNPLLVNIDASIVELTRNANRNVGSLVSDTLAFGDNPLGPTAGQTRADNSFRRITPFQATLSALIQNNQARLLSNPRTTVLSGRSAGFLVGGQVPVPGGTTSGGGSTTTTIVFKDFGVLVDVLPVATSSGNITMRVRTEVSQPDYTLGFTLPGGGSAIPGFTKRVASSEVTIPRGGTIALTGLIQNNVTQFVSRIPLLSRIPILGKLFTSKRFVRNESELVIFLTPRLLPNPLRNGESAPLTVYSGSDNANTPNIGTGGIQSGPITSTPGWGDRLPNPGAPRPPVAAGGGNLSGGAAAP